MKVLKETQSLKDAVNALRSENANLRNTNAKQGRALEEIRTSEESKLNKALAHMTEKHDTETEKLESLFRKKLEVEALKLKNLENERDDTVFQKEEEMAKAAEKHELELQKVQNTHKVLHAFLPGACAQM